uniref:Large ribosomal subunit protein bL32c n=1 Tax=Apophlaea sinclairii TaxID=212746 RepID=A0A1C9CBM9_9FLOR|nr:ribosomal protein L32 [Apophlaea sinclairii]AOM65791.1 ribosomal protein L32 [Apophlaea sinclairii]
MAVPKKRTSKSKSKLRKAKWKRKAYKEAEKALSLAKSVLTNKSKSFIYIKNHKNL